MFGLGPTELIMILALALLIFGPKRLPEIGRTLGKALNELKRASQGIEDSVKKELLLDRLGEDKPSEEEEPPAALSPRERAAMRRAKKEAEEAGETEENEAGETGD